MSIEHAQKALQEIIEKWRSQFGSHKGSFKADILAWHKAELERYGEQVRETLNARVGDNWVNGECSHHEDCHAIDMATIRDMPLPPIDKEGA